MSADPRADTTSTAGLRRAASGQDGVVSRQQLLSGGMSASAVARRVRADGWRVLHPGVYHLDTAPPSPMARTWAAWLYADSALWGRKALTGDASAPPHAPQQGVVAAIGGDAALWLAGLLDDCPDVIEIVVPRERHLARRPGIRVLRREGLPVNGAPSSPPPPPPGGRGGAAGRRPPSAASRARGRPRARCWPVTAHDGAAHPVHSRTTPAAAMALPGQRPVRGAAGRRPLRAGAALRQGRRAGARPAARRAESRRDGPHQRLLAPRRALREHQLVVELDGRAAHPVEGAFRDRRRDNHAARLGETTLRYGWREVAADPCGIAAEVADVLALGDWTGRPRSCRPGCMVARGERGGSLPLGGTSPPRSRAG